MPRLRRSDLSTPGLTRRRRGRGFELLDARGRTVSDPETRLRVAALAIPPAWRDVWICPDPLGHVQATGIDAAERRQYRYHDAWHAQRARVKFNEMEEFAACLPALRRRIAEDIDGDGYERARVLAAMVRLLDVGFFRIGCEEYVERNGSYGIATLRKEHVTVDGATLVFDYPGKSGQRRLHQVVDAEIAELVRGLRRRRGGPGAELFAYKTGGRWVDVRSTDVNAYLKDRSGRDVSAKDFRTWGATVLCAVALAVAEAAPGRRPSRKRVQVQAIREVARYLGNTPAVCRGSYIDPRVLDRHAAGDTIELRGIGDEPEAGPVPETVERAVLRLLGRE